MKTKEDLYKSVDALIDVMFAEEDLEKAEGSRGGKVIGHTKSGKPIYESGNKGKTKGWTAQDHKDALGHHAVEASERSWLSKPGSGRTTDVHKEHAEKRDHHNSLVDFHEKEMNAMAKSMIKDEAPQEETADEAMKKVPGWEDDAKRNAGRSKQISDVPKIDEDGRRQDEYDDAITERSEDGKNPEQDQVTPSAEMVKKSWQESREYAEYVALKKAATERQEEERLQKARLEQVDLIKSAVFEATSSLREENELLKKSLEEQASILKSIANKPQRSQAITSLQSVERFEKSQKSFSREELLDAADELAKSGKLSDVSVIELEQTGYIYDDQERSTLERYMKRR